MFDMALTRSSLTVQLTMWRGRPRAYMWEKGEHFKQLLWQYSAIWQETFQFLSNLTIF